MTTILHADVGEELYNKVQQESKQLDRSKNWVVRNILNSYFNKNEVETKIAQKN